MRRHKYTNCNTLQHTHATRCYAHTYFQVLKHFDRAHPNTLTSYVHIVTHCNKHTYFKCSHCNTSQHTATHTLTSYVQTFRSSRSDQIWYPPAEKIHSCRTLSPVRVLRCVAVCCSVLQCVAVCCSVLQCVAVCYSVLQCVPACCREVGYTH